MTATLADAMMLVAQAGEYGPWETVVNVLRGLVLVCASLGVVMGLAVKSIAAANAEAQELGNRIIVRALGGLMLGLLAEAVYRLIVGWTT